MLSYLFSFVYSVMFFAFPVLVIALFITSLVLYCREKNRIKRSQDNTPSAKLTTYRILLIISSVIMGIVLVVAVMFIATMSMAVAYM